MRKEKKNFANTYIKPNQKTKPPTPISIRKKKPKRNQLAEKFNSSELEKKKVKKKKKKKTGKAFNNNNIQNAISYLLQHNNNNNNKNKKKLVFNWWRFI